MVPSPPFPIPASILCTELRQKVRLPRSKSHDVSLILSVLAWKCASVCPDDVLKEIRPSRNKEVGALQDRIRELEAQVAELSSQHGQSVPASSTRPYFVHTASYDYGVDAGASSRPGSIKDDHQPGASDVAEVMGTLLLGDDGSSRYLGKSAANALFHDDDSDDDDGASIGSDDDEDIANNLSMRLQGTAFPMVSRGLEVQDFQAMLPPIGEARFLAEQYYTNSAYVGNCQLACRCS